MNYQLKNNRLLLIGIILVALVGVGFLLKRPISLLARPVWESLGQVEQGAGIFKSFFSSRISLEKENERLKEKLILDENLILSSRALLDSREAWLKAFGRAASSTGIAASILVRPPETMYDMLVIDVGKAEGVQIGSRVHLPGGGAVGAISETLDHTSKVTLYTTSGLKTQAVLEPSDLPITLTGRGGGNFEFNLPKSIPVVNGNLLLTPDMRGEVLGTVKDVSSKATDSFQSILVEGVVSLYASRYVLVTP